MIRVAARLILDQARGCVQSKGLFTLALSGGRTPAGLYEFLSRKSEAASMPWKKTHIFWGDERLVPRDSEHSNFRLAEDSLLSRIKIPQANVHPMHVDRFDPEENAVLTEQGLRDFFSTRGAPRAANPREDGFPGLDLVLLGLGEDGHTASLFPNSPALAETGRMVAAVKSGPGITPAVTRLTLTLPVLNAARMVVFMVSGQSKHPALKQVLNPVSKKVLPAGLIRPRGQLIWLVHPPLPFLPGRQTRIFYNILSKFARCGCSFLLQ